MSLFVWSYFFISLLLLAAIRQIVERRTNINAHPLAYKSGLTDTLNKEMEGVKSYTHTEKYPGESEERLPAQIEFAI